MVSLVEIVGRLRRGVGAMNLNDNFHKVLKAKRKQMNMTQEEFAKRIGISRSNLANIESGRKSLSLKTIDKINSVIPILVFKDKL